jgi:acetylornithine deacetylase/succinyl-diaminopimelate desuccinylase-like protein
MKLLKNLIAISSLSGEEQAIQTYIANEITSFGFTPLWVKRNLLVHIPGQASNKVILFNAHVDTVPAGKESHWRHHPLKPWVKGEKLFGLGASDEKAGVASLILLSKTFTKQLPACDVWLLFVTKEEVDGSGTAEVLEWWQKNKASKYTHQSAVLVEPTGLKEIEIGHKGNVFLKLTVKGDSGHGSRPETIKTHAVLEMAQALLALPKLSQVWQKKYTDSTLGSPTIGIATSIQAGDSKVPNKFPDICVATLDVRTTPSLHKKVIKEVKAFLNNPKIMVEYVSTPAAWGLTEKQNPIVSATQIVMSNAELSISPGATDQCFFTNKNIPAVVLGPGESEVMHQPNEYCYHKKIPEAVVAYQKIIQTWTQLVK